MRPYVLILSLLLSSSALAAEVVWGTIEAPATRWIEATTREVGKVQPNQRLEVLFREGSRVRVKVSGATFGWIDSAVLTTTAPAGAETGADSGLGGIPGLEGLKLDGLDGLNLNGGLKLE